MNDQSTEIQTKSKLLTYYERYMLVVGILGQLLFYTQGIKIFLTQSAKDVSIIGFLCGLVSVSSWLIYGLLIKNKVLVLSNVVAVVGALLVIVGILFYGK